MILLAFLTCNLYDLNSESNWRDHILHSVSDIRTCDEFCESDLQIYVLQSVAYMRRCDLFCEHGRRDDALHFILYILYSTFVLYILYMPDEITLYISDLMHEVMRCIIAHVWRDVAMSSVANLASHHPCATGYGRCHVWFLEVIFWCSLPWHVRCFFHWQDHTRATSRFCVPVSFSIFALGRSTKEPHLAVVCHNLFQLITGQDKKRATSRCVMPWPSLFLHRAGQQESHISLWCATFYLMPLLSLWPQSTWCLSSFTGQDASYGEFSGSESRSSRGRPRHPASCTVGLWIFRRGPDRNHEESAAYPPLGQVTASARSKALMKASSTAA